MQLSITKTENTTPFYDEAKDVASNYSGKVCRASDGNSPFVRLNEGDNYFRAERGYSFPNFPESEGYYKVNSTDGLGIKPLLADAIREYGGMSRDLLAMSLDDIARYGGMPLILSNALVVKSVASKTQIEAYKSMLDELGIAANEQQIVLLEGETAQHGEALNSPNQNADFPFDWACTAVGINHEKMRITGENLKAGNILITLKQDGFRCNGLSKVREAFKLKYGENWYTDAPREEIQAALSPSIIYSRLISEVQGWHQQCNKRANITGVAHLSGGSFESKLFNGLLEKRGLSAQLDDLYPLQDITKKAAIWLLENGVDFSPEELIKTWSCNQGMIVAVESECDAYVITELATHYGAEAKVAGKVIETPKGKTPFLNIQLDGMQDIYSAGLASHLTGDSVDRDLPNLPERYGHLHGGKVRETYENPDNADEMTLVATDRISTGDVIHDSIIKGKGAALTQISRFWFNELKSDDSMQDILTHVSNSPWAEDYPEAAKEKSMIVRKAKALPIEAIVRGYLGGSVFSGYNKETGKLSTGQFVGKGLQLSSKFNEAQFTPSTKAKTDVNIDKDNMHEVLAPWLIENGYDGIDPKVLAKQIEELSIRIYNFGNKKVQEKGSFIFDTKFEFGLDNDGNLVLIDEILTPDSSRFCKKDGFREGEKPVSADKQFVRDYVEAIWKKYPRSDGEGYPVVLPDHIIKQTEKNYAMMRQLFS